MTVDWWDDNSGRDYVYFAHIGGYVKVGFSFDPHGRVHNLLSNGGGVAWPRYLHPRTSSLHSLHAVPGGRYREAEAHAALDDFREAGEWFIAEPALLAWVNTQDGGPFEHLTREGGAWERPLTAQEVAEQAAGAEIIRNMFASFGKASA